MGLPGIIMHDSAKGKTAATITNDDEHLLDELYQLAKRLDERMDTVERLVASDNPDFKPARIIHDREIDNDPPRALDSPHAAKGIRTCPANPPRFPRTTRPEERREWKKGSRKVEIRG